MNKLNIQKNPNIDIYNTISKAIQENDGYCCCAIEKNADTKCPCKDFREEQSAGVCHCGRYIKIPKSKIVTLCGSTKFKEEFLQVQKELTLKGEIVLTVGLFGHSGDTEAFIDNNKSLLDDLHKSKIAMSDYIYVINKNGYIGKSTQSEIDFAESIGKEIQYLEERKEK